MLNKLDIIAAKEVIQSSDTIVLISHIRPDGDAVGSLLGLGSALENIGKNIHMILVDGLPSKYRFLKNSHKVKRDIDQPFDVIIALDASSLDRLGLEEHAHNNSITINIDHHRTNLKFGNINLVNPSAASTTEIIHGLLKAWDYSINATTASCLLTGLITDTLGFRTINTSPVTMRAAADLIDSGANINKVYFNALNRTTYERVQLWGKGITNLQREGRIAWCSLSLEDKNEVNYSYGDDGDITTLLSTIEGIDIIIVFTEQKNDTVKISWRAKFGFDVSEIALSFNGGGHAPAAGATVEGPLDYVIPQVLERTRTLV